MRTKHSPERKALRQREAEQLLAAGWTQNPETRYWSHSVLSSGQPVVEWVALMATRQLGATSPPAPRRYDSTQDADEIEAVTYLRNRDSRPPLPNEP